MSLMGRAKDVSAIPNLPCIISKEGFQNVKLSYLGGMWVLFEFDSLTSEKFLIFPAWTPNTFRKIASLWGEYVEWEDDDLKSLSCKHFDEPKFPPDFTPDNNDHEKNVAENIKDAIERVQSQINSMTVVRTVDFHHNESMELSLSGKCLTMCVGSSFGCSGGIFCSGILTCSLTRVSFTCDYFVALHEALGLQPLLSFLVYLFIAPQELNERRDLWDYLRTIIDRWEGDTVIMGDFNEVRSEHERFGSTFNRQGAIAFNNFISSARLIDLPLEGYAFTWAHKSASKMSKLDCFLISDRFFGLFPHLSSSMFGSHLFLITNAGNSQKAKIRWSIEGDENSKYFHGIMNKKRSQLAIHGTLANEEWISEPHIVKNEFFTHFKKQFSPIQAPSICFDFTFPTRLSSDQVQDLERPVTYDEVKRAVWDCGTNKSPGPDGFSFEFYRKYWTIIDDDVFHRYFFVNEHFPRGCNSSFIALIPKIQDAKFVKDFRPISLIGSVYKIIAKFFANRLCLVLPYLISDVQSASVANRQILDGPFILNELISWYETLKAFGFGLKWHNWISSCLNNAMGSVLVNGSPTLEFQFYKGLKQGLKINLHKSKLMGIGVSSNVVAAAASLIGCSILTAPFNYLGVKVGSNMSRINSWDDVISKVSLRLSKWKLKLLSIGDRFTLLKSVSLDSLYHVIFKVPNGVLNHWNYSSDISFTELMVMLGQPFYGIGWISIFDNKGALDTHKLIPRRSPWQDVLLAIHSLQSKCINLMEFIQKKVGNGENTSFWDDSWLGEVALKVLYKRLYALEMCKSISVAEKMGHPSLSHSFRRMLRGRVEQENYGLLCSKVADLVLPNISDRWCWSLEGSQEFSVKSSRILIDNTILPKAEVQLLLWSFHHRYLLRDMVVNLALQKSIALWEFSTKACSLIR
ncbi:RNA-directed DNA polymerase, eukaryota [Tanacetum coccineum]